MAVQNQRLPSSQQNRGKAPTPTPTTTMPINQSTTATATPTTQANGGPRVSFNRDVHVKRIGKHPDELTNYETTNLHPPQNSHIHSTAPPYHQLPADLSAESIRREAALVLAQAERHKSIAENADNIPTFRVKTKRSHGDTHSNSKKFHSLPTRKKRATSGKPVARSVSDAAAKKPSHKRPSIFNIFSRKSDSNINQSIERDPRFEDSGGRRLVRSKSDVGSDEKKKLKRSSKENQYNNSKQQTLNTSTPASNSTSRQSHSHTPLSPIIENAQKEDYFAEQFNRERRKSDAITEREKNDSGVCELLERSPLKAESDGNLLSQPATAANGASKGIKDKIISLQSKSNDNMHSSQLPPQKLPLTKGVTVDGMVKRLSMERFSPPPTITSPAFSYIRPNEGITYAQLDLSDDSQQQQQYHHHHFPSTVRPQHRDYRSPMRDVRSPDREFNRPVVRSSVDRTDAVTSQKNLKNIYGNIPSVEINSKPRARDTFSPAQVAVGGPTTIRISSSHSPSPWQQLSPRNLSDEDEGLGIETRKYFDDDLSKTRSKSPAEPPIVPVIRSINSPTRENGYNHTSRAYLSPARDDPAVDGLGYRRAQLESRILTRRFGESNTGYMNGHTNSSSPERNRDVHVESTNSHHRYLSPERERTSYERRFHKPESSEILHKYSPERSHLDIISPATTTTVTSTVNAMPKVEKTSRYRHTKYYNDDRGDGDGRVKEVYERETHVDAQGKPHISERRYREPVADSSIERQQFIDYEPKSLDSQFTSTDQYRSSPENMKHQHQRDEHWNTSSLKRNKLQQRSFDKGDSGIENDFRKESFNGGDISNRWRKRTPIDDMKACETFLKKERRHTEQQYTAARRKDDYIYRERSIDDGSHFDPHLDKYTITSNRHATLQRRDQQSQTGQGQDDTLKRNKKLGGFEKVKQLFTGGGGGGGGSGGGSGRSSHSAKKEDVRANSTTSSSTQTPSKLTDKDKYMVKEEEMRSRYREHRGNLQNEALLREPKLTDISTRRRLSTPKASPLLLKRTSSDKAAKKKESPLAKQEKTSWFKSLDRRSRSKSKEKLNAAETTGTLKRSKVSTTSRLTAKPPPAPPSKNLRFFGDTDLDSNPPTVSRAATTLKSRPAISSSTLNRSQKYSQSAYNLDRVNGNDDDYRRALSNHQNGQARQKSTSMHNLESGGGPGDEVDFRKRRHYSRSRELHDISESGSETEEQHKRPLNGIGAGRTLSRERLDRGQRYDENSYRRSNDRRESTPIVSSTPNGVGRDNSNSMQRRSQLTGPPKPARSAERRILSSHSRERERFPGESSGTEGESSLHSQRSIVYLHATTVGAIPQPYHLRRRTMSREELRSNKSKNSPAPLQPMTRTVSRSVSLLAPWKPKLISEGYEINYSQEQNNRMSTLPHKSHLNGGNSSTLNRGGGNKKSTEATRRIKDDQSSLRNSSTTSASKSMLSSNLRSAHETKRKNK